jgi:DASH complex subunit ASK1
MSRQSVARNLTLTEELERLEQSITLTLQEIDSNFSKSHRIVTTSILPLVEHYGEHSRAVWEASKVAAVEYHIRGLSLMDLQFWKQFFEASANVSLSGYEELANDEEEEESVESTAMRDETTADYTAQHGEEDVTTTTGAEQSTYQMEESLLDDAELSGSTPRPPSTKTTKTRYSWHESPYETMKREMEYEEHQTTVLDDNEDSTVLFAQHTARLPDIALTPGNALDDDHTIQQSIQRGKDPLLHRILDKNYRIQATPLKTALRISPLKVTQHPKKETPAWQDDEPMSSPEMEMPKLRSEAFMSPFKTKARERLAAATQAPRTPGVSVQTPLTARKTRDVFADDSVVARENQQKYEIDWQSDEDDDIDLYAGMSPPKTIQFALPPSKLLQTPGEFTCIC